MSDITLFNFEGSPIRVLVDDKGVPWFVANDIAAALGYERPQKAVLDHVESDDLLIQGVIDSMGRTQNTNTINQSGLYSLAIASKLEGGRRFKRWVTSEVLPSISKTGSYSRNLAPPQAPVLSAAAEGRATVFETVAFMRRMMPTITSEMANACTLRALEAGGYVPKPVHEELRNMLSLDWDKAPSLTPTQIGQELGLRAEQVNRLLAERGFRTRVGKRWEPTDAGKEYAGAVPYQSEYGEHKGA